MPDVITILAAVVTGLFDDHIEYTSEGGVRFLVRWYHTDATEIGEAGFVVAGDRTSNFASSTLEGAQKVRDYEAARLAKMDNRHSEWACRCEQCAA
jgi:hypothetical protein